MTNRKIQIEAVKELIKVADMARKHIATSNDKRRASTNELIVMAIAMAGAKRDLAALLAQKPPPPPTGHDPRRYLIF